MEPPRAQDFDIGPRLIQDVGSGPLQELRDSIVQFPKTVRFEISYPNDFRLSESASGTSSAKFYLLQSML